MIYHLLPIDRRGLAVTCSEQLPFLQPNTQPLPYRGLSLSTDKLVWHLVIQVTAKAVRVSAYNNSNSIASQLGTFIMKIKNSTDNAKDRVHLVSAKQVCEKIDRPGFPLDGSHC
jgi:hypothetical protein